MGLDFILTGAFIDRSGAEEKKIPERNGTFLCVVKKKREGKEEAQADEWPDQGGGDLFEWITNQRSAGEKGRPAAAAAARCAFKRRAFRPTGPFILANKLHGKKKESNKLRFF